MLSLFLTGIVDTREALLTKVNFIASNPLSAGRLPRRQRTAARSDTPKLKCALCHPIT
jgi:hypothetical protein